MSDERKSNAKSRTFVALDIACRVIGWIIVSGAALLALDSLIPGTDPGPDLSWVYPCVFIMTMIGLALALLRPGAPGSKKSP